jgi:pimeloyl-ACP methyl ester carboxylesterase
MAMAETTTPEATEVQGRKPARLVRGLAIGAAALVAIIGIITLLGVLYRPDLSIPAERAGEHIEVAGNPIRYVQKGTGPDILLIHGCPGSIEDWEAVFDELAGEFRVTAYDRPGHGYSGNEANEWTCSHHAGVALALIEKLDLRDVVVVGHSFGGTTALAVAARKPDRVKSIVVLDSAVYELEEKPSLLYRTLAIPGFGTGMARLIGPTVAPAKIREGIEAQFPGAVVPAGFIETRTAIWNQPKVTTSVARESLRSSAELVTLAARYREITLPTFIAAQADNPLRREEAERLHGEIASSELVLLPDTGHYVQFQKPAEVIALIRRAAGSSAAPASDSESATQ